jgi:hypothetical protein
MKLWGMSADFVDCIVQAVSDNQYGGNVIFKRPPERDGRAISFTLTVKRSDGPGARRSATGRRISAACWHAHRDVLGAIFRVAPDGRVKSAFADYRGALDFEDKFDQTGLNYIDGYGTVRYRDACECGG